MKILRHGKGFQLRKQRKIRCDYCGCKYIADAEDAYECPSVIGNINYYADCPQCEHGNLYQSKFNNRWF